MKSFGDLLKEAKKMNSAVDNSANRFDVDDKDCGEDKDAETNQQGDDGFKVVRSIKLGKSVKK